jgi:hypothetical protein
MNGFRFDLRSHKNLTRQLKAERGINPCHRCGKRGGRLRHPKDPWGRWMRSAWEVVCRYCGARAFWAGSTAQKAIEAWNDENHPPTEGT